MSSSKDALEQRNAAIRKAYGTDKESREWQRKNGYGYQGIQSQHDAFKKKVYAETVVPEIAKLDKYI